MGFMQTDCRLAPSSWKKREDFYTLSENQLKQLEPLYKLASSPEDEAVMEALAPPLANALAALIKKNVDYHMVSLLFSFLSTTLE